MSAALALPGPFDFSSPPRGGLIGGGTRLAPTQAEVIQFVRDLVKNNVTNPFPPPPAFVGPAGAAAATLVAAELLFPPSAGEPGEWDPASGLDPYGNPLDPQAPGAVNGDRGGNADPPVVNGNFEYDQGLTGVYKIRYDITREFGATFYCSGGAKRSDYERTDDFDQAKNITCKTLTSKLVPGRWSAVCGEMTGQYGVPLWTLTIDGTDNVTLSGNEGDIAAGSPRYRSIDPNFIVDVKIKSITFEDTDITNYEYNTTPTPVATPPVTAATTAAAITPKAAAFPTWWYGGPRVASAQGTGVNQPAESTDKSITRQLWTDPANNPFSPGSIPFITPNAPVFPGTANPTVTTTGAPTTSPPKAIPITPPDVHFPDPGLRGEDGKLQGVNPGGIRDTNKAIAAEVGRVEQKSAGTLSKVRGILDSLADLYLILEFLEYLKDKFQGPMPSKEYSITAICETPNESGEQPSTSVILPEEDTIDRLLSLGDMMPDLLQAHLGYKTPTCGSSKTNLAGSWVSTRWVSDGNSDNGERPLRKLFRYRSKSTRNVDQLQAWWAPFTWSSGATIVSHKGAWWGTPQVWASNEAEGKRVIRFAAVEAGIDPDLDGEWVVASSSSARYGMSDTMRLAKTNGEYWATRRDGPSALPELTVDP